MLTNVLKKNKHPLVEWGKHSRYGGQYWQRPYSDPIIAFRSLILHLIFPPLHPRIQHSAWHLKANPHKKEFIYKKLCIYSYMFKLQPPSNFFPFDAKHLTRLFFHCSKVFEFVNLSILMPFSISAIFLFHLFYIGKTFPLEDIFSYRETNKKMLLR